MIPPLYTFGATVEHLAQMTTGDIVRYGAILKDSQTGRIVGHIQETGLWRDAVSGGADLLKGAATGTNPALSIFTAIQNEQIKSRLDEIETLMGSMQNLQLATLATSVVGIGVTMASTAIILNRLTTLEKATDHIIGRLNKLPAIWEEARVRGLLSDMQTSLERLDESTRRSDCDQIIRSSEENLHHHFNQFSNVALKMTVEAKVDADLLRVLLAAMSTCAGAQYKAMLQLDEMDGALLRSQSQYNTLEKLSWALPPDVLNHKLIAEAGQAEIISDEISELRASLACRPHALETMIANGIHGPDIITQAMDEKNEALLVLPTHVA